MIFPLVQDFADALAAMPRGHPRHRLLTLLDEAVRRDVHFIERHPTTVFQCLWNSGWWYDCAPRGEHVVASSPAAPRSVVTLWLSFFKRLRQRSKPSLSKLLGRWRKIKDRATPGFSWVRAIRPPAVPLGMAQRLLLQIHNGKVHDIALAIDGTSLASAGADGVRVTDIRNGRVQHCFDLARESAGSDVPPQSALLAEFLQRCASEEALAVAFTPDGTRLAVGSADGIIRLWDVAAGRLIRHLGQPTLARTPSGTAFSTPQVNDVAFDVTGQYLAAGTADWKVRVWDCETGQERWGLTGHEDVVHRVAFSPDGRWLASASADRTVRLWESATGRPGLELRGHGHRLSQGIRREKMGVVGVAFSPDGKRLASAGDDGTIRLWDTGDGRELGMYRGHEDSVCCVSFSRDGGRLASGSADRTVRIWHVDSYEQRACYRGHADAVARTIFLADERVVSASWDQTIRVWDSGDDHPAAELRGHKHDINHAVFSPRGDRFATASEDHTVRLWAARTGHELFCLRGHKERAICVAFSADGRLLASGSYDCTVIVWDVKTGRMAHVLRGQRLPVTEVYFTPDNRFVAAWTGTGTVKVWEAATGREVVAKPLCERVDSLIRGANNDAGICPAPYCSQPPAESVPVMRLLAAHRPGKLWAGVFGNYLGFFATEGDQ